MPPGAFTDDIDLIQVLLVAFFLFFAVLIIYLRREDKREGYPLVTRTARRYSVIGWPAPPPAKTYRLMDGGAVLLPHHYPEPSLGPGVRDGDAFVPPGDPLLAGLGAGAFTQRSDAPMRTLDNSLLLAPLRDAHEWTVNPRDPDPRGMRVLGRNFVPVGIVRDLWVDRAARILRYLEVQLDAGEETLLLPIYHADIRIHDREIRVKALAPDQFVHVPRLANPGVMTAREEDRINAFYAGGTIYSEPA